MKNAGSCSGRLAAAGSTVGAGVDAATRAAARSDSSRLTSCLSFSTSAVRSSRRRCKGSSGERYAALTQPFRTVRETYMSLAALAFHELHAITAAQRCHALAGASRHTAHSHDELL